MPEDHPELANQIDHYGALVAAWEGHAMDESVRNDVSLSLLSHTEQKAGM